MVTELSPENLKQCLETLKLIREQYGLAPPAKAVRVLQEASRLQPLETTSRKILLKELSQKSLVQEIMDFNWLDVTVTRIPYERG